MNNKIKGHWDFTLIFLLLQMVFVPFWEGIKIFDLAVLILFSATFIIRLTKPKRPFVLAIVGVFFFGLSLIQGVLWGFSLSSSFNSFMLTYFVAYLAWEMYGNYFFLLIERVFLRVSIISVFFWFAINWSSSIMEQYKSFAEIFNIGSGDAYGRSVLVFTHWEQIEDDFLGLSRFSGFFHEPGALAFFTVFIFILRYSRIGKMDLTSYFYLFLIIISFSSAGYASLAFLIMGIIMNWRSGALRYLALLPLVFVIFFAYTEINFLQDKIERQIAEQTESDINEATVGRIIGYRKSIYVLQKYPFYGRGLLAMTKPKDRSHSEYADYGWLSFLSRIGLIAGIPFLIYFIRGYRNEVRRYKRYNNWFVGLSFMALLINLTAQNYVESIPMLILFFNGLTKQ